MVEVIDIYVFVLAATALLSLVVALVAWDRRAASGARAVLVMMLGVSAWCGSEAMFWSKTSFESQVLWLKLSYLGISATIVGFVIFGLAMAKIPARRTLRGILLVSFPVAMVCIMAMTNAGGLVSTGYSPQHIGSRLYYMPQNGLLFSVYILVTYGMYLFGFFLIARVGVRSIPPERTHAGIVLTATAIPFAVSAWNQLRPIPVEGLEAAAFFATGVLFLLALIRGQLLDASGHVVTAQDAADAERRELKLRAANRDLEDSLKATGLYRALTELMPDLVFVIDSDMRVVLANSAAARFVGRSLEQLEGARFAELFGPMGALFEEHLSQTASSGQALDFENALPAGESETWLRTSLVSLADVAQGLVLGVSRDITDSKHLETALRERVENEERLATHDALTGLDNRRAFMTALEHALALARRGIASTVFFMDIDDFKLCNDQRGHAFGDEVLISVAGLLKSQVREVDVVARFGGDEFAALLAGASKVAALAVAKRMTASVDVLGDGFGIPISLAIGIVGVDASASLDGVIATADSSMYEHKMAHRLAREAAEKT